MTELKRQRLIENHVDNHNGSWYNIIGLYEDGVMIVWGRDGRNWTKFISYGKDNC